MALTRARCPVPLAAIGFLIPATALAEEPRGPIDDLVSPHTCRVDALRNLNASRPNQVTEPTNQLIHDLHSIHRRAIVKGFS